MIHIEDFGNIYLCVIKKGDKTMVSLKNFVEDLREERREEKERGLISFTLLLTGFFLVLSIWATI